MKSTIYVVLICCVLALDADSIDHCSAAKTCDACLAAPGCAWCFEPRTIFTPRCLSPAFQYSTRTSGSVCADEYLYNPMNLIETLKAKDFSYLPTHSANSSSPRDHQNSEKNYITPEHVRASIRVGSSYRLRTNYVVTEDFPVDIYLVMDMRKPRENKNQQLNSLASNVVDTMRNTTSDFSVGLGYISGSSRPIIHHTSLTMNTSALLHSVEQLVARELPVSEGAPLGAIVETACSGNIGWRTQSQKIIIFVTDRDYEGHHNDNHANTESTSDICSRDFSSETAQTVYQPSEIRALLYEKQIRVIFVVTDDVTHKYRKLRNRMGYSAVTSLTRETSNVGTLLENLYMTLSLGISLTDDNSSKYLRVKYFTKCLIYAETETNKCHGVKVGDQVTYDIVLELLSCPADSKDWTQKLQIRPKNLNGLLTVDLKFYCSCPAEMQQSPECNWNGRFVNDQCVCHENYFGRYCECSTASGIMEDNCRPDYNTTTVECSARGSCICGQCECETRERPEERIYGRYCECDDISCERGNGLLCSGHGTCVCGQCECREDWSGSSCNCSTNTDTCIAPSGTNQEICSGHGECICGQCQCANDEDGNSYTGQYCTNESTK